MTKAKRMILALTIVCGATSAFAQSEAASRFGAREPRTCANRKEPAKGAPSPDQLKQYLICDVEHYNRSSSSGDSLDLITDVKVDVGKSRPFFSGTDEWPDVDPSQPVFPVRATYTWYACRLPVAANIPGNAPRTGKNCFKYQATNAGGIFYKDTFGEWHSKVCCAVSATGSRIEYFPPPTGK